MRRITPDGNRFANLVNDFANQLAADTGHVGIRGVTVSKELGQKNGLAVGRHECLTAVGVITITVEES